MATPYGNPMGMPPQGMQQQPMQPMGMGQPQPAQPPPRPVRRGTSKAVPVVMSAGLAVGVFCGLLFGLGTGNEGALASTTATTVATGSGSDVPDVLKAPSAADGTAKTITPTPVAPTPVPAAVPAGSGSGSAVAAAGSGSGSAAPAVAAGSGSGSASGSAAAPTPAAVATTGKLKIELSPDSAGSGAKITVDGKDFTPDMTFTMDPGATKKTVDVVVHATGFHEFEQKVDVTPGDTSVKFELVKRSGGGVAPTAGSGATPVAKSNGNSGNNPPRPTWTGTQAVPANPPKTNPGTQPKQPPKQSPKQQPKANGGLIDI